MSVNRNVHLIVLLDDVNWPATRVRHEKFLVEADHMRICVCYSASLYTGDDTLPFYYSISDLSFTQDTRTEPTEQDK